jgi:magnesium chelatase family protein
MRSHDLEADLVQGLLQFMISGLPDAACKQSPDRIKAAAANSGMSIPNRRLTANLSPASMPKAGSGFDLANSYCPHVTKPLVLW